MCIKVYFHVCLMCNNVYLKVHDEVLRSDEEVLRCTLMCTACIICILTCTVECKSITVCLEFAFERVLCMMCIKVYLKGYCVY